MIREVRVNNFKSITELTLELGRVTVLIGANGSGKSNILESIALASAAAQYKLDNEFLFTRGIRVTETRFMRSAFQNLSVDPDASQKPHGNDTEPSIDDAHSSENSIKLAVKGDQKVDFQCELFADDGEPFPKWHQRTPANLRVKAGIAFDTFDGFDTEQNRKLYEMFLQEVSLQGATGALPCFLVYAPENSALRTFQSEGQILPLGIKGEGLFAHLRALNSEKHGDRLVEIKKSLTLIDWFDGFDVPADLSPGERSIRIRDRYLSEGALFDQRSANEGFLFLLFYVTLFASPDAPTFFSIDNIDTSLNPKLCIALLQQIAALARKYDKQVILTTHNPAVLDGLDLQDDEQRLFVVERNKAGHTRVRRVHSSKLADGQLPVSLSEAFMRGYIGGLPKNF